MFALATWAAKRLTRLKLRLLAHWAVLRCQARDLTETVARRLRRIAWWFGLY